MANQHSSRDTRIALAIVILFFGGIAAYYLLRPDHTTVTAKFQVSSWSQDATGNEQPLNSREYDIYQRTQIALLQSYFVIQAALRAPGMQSLSILAPHEDKVEWLIDNLDSSFKDGSEILEIKLTGPAEQEEDLRQLVDAVCEAYLKEVVFTERQRRLVVHDAMQMSLQRLRDRIRQQLEIFQDLKAELGDKANDSAELEVMRKELDTLERLQERLLMRVESIEMLDNAPDRIRRVQKATIEKD